LVGQEVEAYDDSLTLEATGKLARHEGSDLPGCNLPANLREALQSAETAETFLLGQEGTISFFESEFQSATWDPAWHVLTIRMRGGTIHIRDYLASK
jgi:hypothetical protein